jgi:hypothetical protein
LNALAKHKASTDHFLGKNYALTLPDDFELSGDFLAGFTAIEGTDQNLYITGGWNRKDDAPQVLPPAHKEEVR